MAEDKIEKQASSPNVADVAEGNVLKMNKDEMQLANLGYKQGELRQLLCRARLTRY
jgi:hypothetical protein